MYDLYRAAVDYCLGQDPECTIIYGGDACDRGPDGYKIMKELLNHPQIGYLKGNHEDIFVHAAWFILRNYKGSIDSNHIFDYLYSHLVDPYKSSEISLSLQNGGFQTLTDWMLDGMPEDFVLQISQLPLTFSYEGLDFCHAGGDPKVFVRIARNEYDDTFINKNDQFNLLWDRNWLGFGWLPTRTCIFGHTPTPHLPTKYYGKDKSINNAHPCKYVGQIDDRLTGARLDMDTGAFASGRLYVLNCLTMKAQGFLYNKLEVEKIEVIQF